VNDIPTTPVKNLLTDCPYCGGEGIDPTSALGLCTRCHGKGRMAHFLAERAAKRLALKRASAHHGVVVQDAIADLPPNQW
jgi:hypothetical protein